MPRVKKESPNDPPVVDDVPAPEEPEPGARVPAGRRKRGRPPRHLRPEVPIESNPGATLELSFEPAAGKPERGRGGDEVVTLPVIPLRDMVIFPHMVTQFFVGREISLQAVAAAVASDHRILAIAQREA